jgi:hypothetical protein
MLAPTATPTDPTCLAHQLRHQAFNVTSPNQVVTVATVVAHHNIIISHVIENRDRVGLLTHIAVRRPKQLPFGEQLKDALLKASYQHHLRVEFLSQLRYL